MNIGSRPSKRKPSGGISTLRAIPWIFAWTQTRFHLPVWLGAGEAIMQVRALCTPQRSVGQKQPPPCVRCITLGHRVHARASAGTSLRSVGINPVWLLSHGCRPRRDATPASRAPHSQHRRTSTCACLPPWPACLPLTSNEAPGGSRCGARAHTGPTSLRWRADPGGWQGGNAGRYVRQVAVLQGDDGHDGHGARKGR